MENPVVAGRSPEMLGAISTGGEGSAARKEKRKALKKLKRKRLRQEIAIREKELEEARANDPEEQIRLKKLEEEERERVERERKEFEERERIWIEAKKRRDEEEEEAERQRKLLEDSEELDAKNKEENLGEDEEFEYVEEGPAEIIWKGNEIIVKKKTVKVPKKSIQIQPIKENLEKPTSNPLPPNPESFPSNSAQEILEKIAQETPNFGTELDKAHCPFQLKTGACRFGTQCNRLHFYPEKSCTLLVKNMYNGPGLSFEQDEGLEYTDEEMEKSYEEFYEDVHTEFLKFGELVNFKVCRNGSYHLRGNVYVHYKSLDSALLAFNHINCRFFAGKQISCEFVGVTRWKVAICGEYMKTRLKTCSRGSACNFIHCFRNPCGDYEWANFDNPPPKSWIRKMVSLFGFSDQSYCASKALESNGRKPPTPTNDSRSSRRREYSRSRERSYERQRDSSSRTHEERHNSRDGKREKEREFESKREKERRMELSIDEERYNGGVYPKRDFDLEKEYFEIKSEREKHYREYSVERETNGDESKGKFSRKSRKEKHERIDSDKHDLDLGSKKHRKRESSRKKRDEFFKSEEREENDHYDYREYKRSEKDNYEDKSSNRHKISV